MNSVILVLTLNQTKDSLWPRCIHRKSRTNTGVLVYKRKIVVFAVQKQSVLKKMCFAIQDGHQK